MELSSSPTPNFYDFLHRMRQPAAADLVRTIKNFIVSFSLQNSYAEDDSKRIQDFLMAMETTISEHPLWAHASDEEINSAIEGLEKYIMTKLFNKTFASSSDDVNLDKQISEKICLLQHFIKPEHLDMPRFLWTEASWLVAAKELQKINGFKAPREKLYCIMNCCQIINNLLLQSSISLNQEPPGADTFLPILIYVTIKANPPQLHSNLKYVQLFRRHSKLVSDVEYYLTNLISVKTFIADMNASSISMEEDEFEKNMKLARSATGMTVAEAIGRVQLSEENTTATTSSDKGILVRCSKYPFIEAEAEDLGSDDVQKLLGLYKQMVAKYEKLSDEFKRLSTNKNQVLRFPKDPSSQELLQQNRLLNR